MYCGFDFVQEESHMLRATSKKLPVLLAGLRKAPENKAPVELVQLIQEKFREAAPRARPDTVRSQYGQTKMFSSVYSYTISKRWCNIVL